jgi:hypothetical protein
MNVDDIGSVADGYGIPGVGLDGDEIPCRPGGLCGNPLMIDTRMNGNDVPCPDGSINPLLDRQEGAIGGSPCRVISQSVAAAIGTIGADVVRGGMNIGKQTQPGDQKWYRIFKQRYHQLLGLRLVAGWFSLGNTSIYLRFDCRVGDGHAGCKTFGNQLNKRSPKDFTNESRFEESRRERFNWHRAAARSPTPKSTLASSLLFDAWK